MKKSTKQSIELKDQIGNQIHLGGPPTRIVSLVPSITETLYDLGLDHQIVGRTKFCIHPAQLVSNAQRIGGTKNVNIQKVKDLKPDLIIANKEENTKEIINDLQGYCPIYISNVKDISGSLALITDLGKLTNRIEESRQLVNDIIGKKEQLLSLKPLKAIYLIWQNPYMTVGGDTFINSMMLEAGYANVYQNDMRYPEVNIEQSIEDLDVILLSSEPFPFKETHALTLQSKYNIPVQLVDGELFSWYGSRMLKSWEYFRKLRQIK